MNTTRLKTEKESEKNLAWKELSETMPTKTYNKKTTRRHFLLLSIIITAILARMEFAEHENKDLKRQVYQLQTQPEPKPIEPTLMHASFDPYAILDDTPECESRMIMILGGKKICAPI